ncbi:TIGR01458 family HAD-type hydrolase [Geoalkalibacter halelectricus]|uniref:Haloacid dehalogenase-like hydrolase domain-containing protein 2 n=1 Tax=Geoalkalibacter halelectricus TaxID=2847045 RepID=A0ABY5ZHK5_9BACT|nr:TIGR01458 family HAD-type hydrolase [Geoalkalibacter halelectricus]MDO3379626.1 TIGR01458 family HAD-type hydrolase [Geoalkalibacter halelectricus]UWZ78558.1 TIGR01458 family HAD-type hydrolase [Geoalkalibacter halelectricus]
MPFELWRQDDHGHRYLVGVFAERRHAEEKMRHLTRVPHKQMYWIQGGADAAVGRQSTMTKGVLIDLSGTVHQGEKEIPGAVAAVRRLQQSGLGLRFVTNTSRMTGRMLQELLGKLGLEVPDAHIFSAPRAMHGYLREKNLRPFLLVHPRLREEFADLCQENPNAVVIGLAEEEFHYANLNAAFRLLLAGAPLLSLGRTRYFEGESGLQLDAGPFVTALEYAAGTQARVLGKPAREFFLAAAAELDLQPAEVVMIGDDAASDVGGALAAGLRAILVRTGKYRRGDEDKIGQPGGRVAKDLAAAAAMILRENEEDSAPRSHA